MICFRYSSPASATSLPMAVSLTYFRSSFTFYGLPSATIHTLRPHDDVDGLIAGFKQIVGQHCGCGAEGNQKQGFFSTLQASCLMSSRRSNASLGGQRIRRMLRALSKRSLPTPSRLFSPSMKTMSRLSQMPFMS